MRMRGMAGLMGFAAFALAGALFGADAKAGRPEGPSSLTAPAKGTIPVAFVLTKGAVMIDFAGPWEVFQDVYVPSRGGADAAPFELYTVSESKEPIRVSGGMKVVPDYTFDNAPQPKVIVIPAQGGATQKAFAWIKKSSAQADVVMSVCTGAFVLAETGLLSGKSATTHHSSYRTLAMKYPDIHVERGVRFVESGNTATAGGLASGIDLALRVVERYFGREAAAATAYQMEYAGDGWKNPEANAVYKVALVSTDEHPLCPICEMDIDKASSPKSVYQGRTYYFCSTDHKDTFDKSPSQFVEPMK